MPKQKRAFDVLVEAKLRVEAFDAESAQRKAERSLRRGRDIDQDVVAMGDVRATPQDAARTPVPGAAKAARGRATAAKAGNAASTKKTATSHAGRPVVKKTASKGAPAATTNKRPSRMAAVPTTRTAGAKRSTTAEVRQPKRDAAGPAEWPARRRRART